MSSNSSSDVCNFKTDVALETSMLFSGLSIVSLVLMSAILYLYSKGNEKSLGNECNLGMLFFSILVTVTADLSYQEVQRKTYFIYEIVVIFVFGIGIICYGAYKFFDIRRHDDDIKAIGEGNPHMSFFTWIITLLLAVLELFLFIGALIENDFLSALLIMAELIQKLLQAGLYHFDLRHRIPAKNKECGASWYLKIIALFNFSMWLESIMVADKVGEKIVKDVLKGGYSVFASIHAAMLIDYRLLLCMLFIEHSLVIDHRLARNENKNKSRACSPLEELTFPSLEKEEKFKVETSRLAGLGFICGMCLAALQLMNALQYTQYLGPWTGLFGISADIIVAICAGFLIKQVGTLPLSTKKIKKRLPLGVDILVVGMGTIGLIFWVLKGAMATIWAGRVLAIPQSHREYQYLCWNGIKDCLRPLSILIQVYFFATTDIESLVKVEVKKTRSNHFLIPFLMMAFLSVFLNSLTDVYDGLVEELAEKANMSMIVLVLYKCGEPIHLGFALHMFVHLFIVNKKLKTVPPMRRYDRLYDAAHRTNPKLEVDYDDHSEQPLGSDHHVYNKRRPLHPKKFVTQ